VFCSAFRGRDPFVDRRPITQAPAAPEQRKNPDLAVRVEAGADYSGYRDHRRIGRAVWIYSRGHHRSRFGLLAGDAFANFGNHTKVV
jgi:hypothetical protein